MFKQLWLIWCRTVDHRIGKTDQDEPDIPNMYFHYNKYST